MSVNTPGAAQMKSLYTKEPFFLLWSISRLIGIFFAIINSACQKMIYGEQFFHILSSVILQIEYLIYSNLVTCNLKGFKHFTIFILIAVA